ncbi:FAD-dependent oxidoreductase [Devosia sp. FKR38]|uniref:FAD-dependent oxidoreductase n=1 Tax=Devosia sp. FKR38 TaxID=2562312 RepID=UPI0010C0B6C5|nr:FAD-dependent oxidoreductase [Devosia sp. FKR38]
MPDTGQTFFIAGAGISGLTLALALAQRGGRVTVLERNERISEFGAGLQISPNARRVLDRLGLDSAVAGVSLEPTGIDLFPQDATTPLTTLALGPAMRSRFGAPYVVMHRADLVETLYQAARRDRAINVLFGVRQWDVVSHARGVSVSIDTADGEARTSRGKAFIGADGVHSQTRRQVLEGPDARFGERVAWRTLLPFDAVRAQLGLDRVTVLFAPDYHVVCYPLPHRGQVNIALFVHGPASVDKAGSVPALPGTRRNPRLAAILAAAGNSWTPWPLYTVTTPVWHRGHIGLIGDAAHAMVPFQAQGAAMGIEDAAVLAPLLLDTDDAEAAFARYAAIRQPRVSRVARTSLNNGRIFHLGWPMSKARDSVIVAQGPTGHLNRLSWLYGHDAQAADTASSRPPTQPKSAGAAGV